MSFLWKRFFYVCVCVFFFCKIHCRQNYTMSIVYHRTAQPPPPPQNPLTTLSGHLSGTDLLTVVALPWTEIGTRLIKHLRKCGITIGQSQGQIVQIRVDAYYLNDLRNVCISYANSNKCENEDLYSLQKIFLRWNIHPPHTSCETNNCLHTLRRRQNNRHFAYNILSQFLALTLWHFDSNTPGGRLNKKDGLTRYGDSHVKDKTS